MASLRSRKRRGGDRAADPVAASQERMRRAFARRRRARQWLTWRRILVGLVVVSLVGLGVYALFFSSWLRTEGVEVVGNAQLSDEQVAETAEVRTGGALVGVDLDAIATRVRSLATVKSVDVSRKWPHHVRIEIVERTPVAVLDRGDTFTYLDADGVAFGRIDKAPAGLPRVKVGGGADEDALEEGAAVVRVLDARISELLDFLEVRTVDEIVLHLRDNRTVQWGSAEQAEDKARVLLELLQVDAQTYDVSVPGAPTTR